jgi:hypothetical protein
VDGDFYSADAPGALEFAQIKVTAQKAFRLTENCAYHVRLFDNARRV